MATGNLVYKLPRIEREKFMLSFIGDFKGFSGIFFYYILFLLNFDSSTGAAVLCYLSQLLLFFVDTGDSSIRITSFLGFFVVIVFLNICSASKNPEINIY